MSFLREAKERDDFGPNYLEGRLSVPKIHRYALGNRWY